MAGGKLVRRAEMGEIARLDRLDRHDDEDVGRAELMVDHRAVADIGADPQIALDQRRQRLDRGAHVDRLARHHVHVDAQMLMRLDAPILRRERVMVEIAQRRGMRRGVGAREAGAADHDVGAMLAHIGPHALPQQLERALVAIGLEHAGAAKLHEAVVGPSPGAAARCRIRLACRSRHSSRPLPGAACDRCRPPSSAASGVRRLASPRSTTSRWSKIVSKASSSRRDSMASAPGIADISS